MTPRLLRRTENQWRVALKTYRDRYIMYVYNMFLRVA